MASFAITPRDQKEKTAEEKGRYLHPELWGRPKEEQIHHRLVAEAGRLTVPRRPEKIERVDRSRLEEERRRMEELLQRMKH